MSTLFLTSAGIKIPIIKKEFTKILPKTPRELTLVHIVTASKVITDTAFVNKDKTVMKKMGFKVIEYDLDGKSQNNVKDTLTQANIVYVQGGNGFYLLKKVKESGFDKVIKDLITKGLIYVGVSAGTYIACPTIEMHTWKREVDDLYGLSDLAAMNLVPFLISVHYNREKYRELLSIKITTASHPVKILTDEQALLVQNGKTKLVGDGDEIKI